MKGKYAMTKKRPQSTPRSNPQRQPAPTPPTLHHPENESISHQDETVSTGLSEIQADLDAGQRPLAVDPLMSEVEVFLSRRAELSRRLEEEIRATEQRLAELRQTAARLFPESQKESKDKKARKPRAKNNPKSTESVAHAATASTTSPVAAISAEEDAAADAA